MSSLPPPCGISPQRGSDCPLLLGCPVTGGKYREYPLDISATDGFSTQSARVNLTIIKNPQLKWRLVATPGPGYPNPSMITVIDDDLLRVTEFKAFDTRFGANAVMADIDGDGEDEIVVAPGPDYRAGG